VSLTCSILVRRPYRRAPGRAGAAAEVEHFADKAEEGQNEGRSFITSDPFAFGVAVRALIVVKSYHSWRRELSGFPVKSLASMLDCKPSASLEFGALISEGQAPRASEGLSKTP
jgi:hypothetical protein